jgi:HD-like signal output (HDOD) protein
MRGFFVSEHSFYNQKIQELWRHSIEVASLSYVMAKRFSSFSADQCLLLGLLHNIGSYPVIRYMDAENIKPDSMQHLDAVINKLQSAVSALILEKWEFGAEFSNVALNAVNWNYQSDPGPDVCDLIQMAKIHSMMSRELMSESLEINICELPIIHAIPAFKKLGLDKLTPESAVEFLQMAKREMVETMQLLAA